MEIHLQQVVALGGGQQGVVEHSLLASGHLPVMGIGLVLPLVPGEPVNERAVRFSRPSAGHGMVTLAHLSLLEHGVQPGQGLAGAGKDHHAADRPVEPVNHAQKDLAGLGVLFLDILLDRFRQRTVSGLVALYDFARFLVYNNEVVVFVEYLHGVDLLDKRVDRLHTL